MNIYALSFINEEIIDTFVPTRLYIKELNRKKYFGKTTVKNVHAYTGSGKIWKDRIKKYGKKNIKTLWVSDWFYCPYHIQQFALMFSELNQIVESSEWDNYKPENGLDGGSSHTAALKLKISNSVKIAMTNIDHAKDKNPFYNNHHSEETKLHLSMINKGAKNSQFGKRFSWITNGIANKKIEKTDLLPVGWLYGKTNKLKL